MSGIQNNIAGFTTSPRRLVSVVPSITELLYDLELDEEVLGITKFCIHPDAWFRTKTRVGGTKKLHLEKIVALQPDCIIANKEENRKEDIEWLAAHTTVWLTEINTVNDALKMIQDTGILTGQNEKASDIVRQIKSTFNPSPPQPPKVLYVIWKNPWMFAAKDTFIDSMLEKGGFQNILSVSRYPELSEEAIRLLQPDYVFLSSEPYPFKDSDMQYWKDLLPMASVKCVNGEFFSWYGSRMIQAFDYFRTLHEVV